MKNPRKGSNEVRVKEVSDGLVVIQAGNIEFTFGWLSGRKKLIHLARGKPNVRVLDSSTLHVPDALYKKACRMAAAIFHDRERRRKWKNE